MTDRDSRVIHLHLPCVLQKVWFINTF